MSAETPYDVPKKSFWQRRVVSLLASQLRQGITPEKIALTIALGITLGIFPILGATTTLCALAALCLKLNQPIIQLVNYLFYAVQVSLILVFVRFGEWLTRAERVPFSIPEMMRRFKDSPKQFMHDFGMTGVHAIIGWIVVAPILFPLIYFSVKPPLRKLAVAIGSATSNHAG